MGICVFWIPTIWHSSSSVRLRRIKVEQGISDFGKQTFLQVEIEHNEASVEEVIKDSDFIKRAINVQLSWKDDDEQDVSIKFKLQYKNHSHDGMVVYGYDKPTNYPTTENGPDFDTFLKGICYHHVKSLFHDHEVHSDRDKGLQAYIPEQEQSFDVNSIKENDNKVLLYFIKQYEETFSNYAERLSGELRKYDGIIAKFNVQLSKQDENGGIPGYRNLVDYGLSDFRQWCNDSNHSKEVEEMKKNVLKWSLKIYPHKKNVSHYLYTYNERLDRIEKKYKEVAESLLRGSSTSLQEREGFFDLSKRIIAAFELLDKKNKIIPHVFYRHELEPIDSILSEIEIDLKIFKPATFQYYITPLFFFYRRLQKHYHNISVLTKETRDSIGQTCEGASTEYVYCKTLLESRYNWAFKPNNFSDNAIECRMTALNIRNSIRYIETAKYRCSNAQTDSTHSILYKADKLSKRAKLIAILGIIITFFGLGATIWDIVKNYSSL